MNKNLIAIAITAALAVPSIAAAEVKIIGQAQLELVSTSGDATEGLTLDDSSESGVVGSGNASMIGVTGSHDLGNGMTALYKVNFNFFSDDLANPGEQNTLKDRDQFIGLKGDFGTVLAGTMNTPYKSTTASWDPFLATFLQARGNNGMSKTGGLYNSYGQNVLAYANTFGGTKVVVGVNFDESSDDTAGERDGSHGFHLGVNAPIGSNLELAFGLLTESEDSGTNKSGTATKIGLKWKGDGMSVAGQFETENEDMPVEQDHLYVNFVKELGEGASAAIAFGQSTDNSTAENDGTYVSLGYKKALSKQVSWHGGVVMIDEGIVGANKDVTQIGAGMRVKF